jgi:S-adenosylmethionine hydrolase
MYYSTDPTKLFAGNNDYIIYIIIVQYKRSKKLSRMTMPIVTMLTDFGLKDGNVGVMKGVIWALAPNVQIADLSHLIGPQNVPEAALILLRSAPYFPAGTVHLVVVDPGVGTARRPMAAKIGEHYFVGPDNGVITSWLERAEGQGLTTTFVDLDRPKYWLSEVSHVFHGRDIFAPAAGHLAAGVALEDLGTAITDPVRLQLPQPERTPQGWRGEVIHIDHFGSLASNIYRHHLSGHTVATVRLGGVNIDGMVETFGERPPGELVALFGSTGNLIVSVVNGSAADRLKAHVGDKVEVEMQ